MKVLREVSISKWDVPVRHSSAAQGEHDEKKINVLHKGSRVCSLDTLRCIHTYSSAHLVETYRGEK